MRALFLLPLLVALGCQSVKAPKATATSMGAGHWYRIDGPTWEDCWIKLRYVVGDENGGGVRVWSDCDDADGHHMLVDVIVFE